MPVTSVVEPEPPGAALFGRSREKRGGSGYSSTAQALAMTPCVKKIYNNNGAGAGAGAAILTSWSWSQAKMERLHRLTQLKKY